MINIKALWLIKRSKYGKSVCRCAARLHAQLAYMRSSLTNHVKIKALGIRP